MNRFLHLSDLTTLVKIGRNKSDHDNDIFKNILNGYTLNVYSFFFFF